MRSQLKTKHGFLPLFLTICLGFWSACLQAQVTPTQVSALVEALRLAAPDTGIEDDGLYSEWQVKPDNITRWSGRCLGETLTVEEFHASSKQARRILECKMREVFDEQYAVSQGDESLAVQRTAAWWMTGDPNSYDQASVDTYINKVLNFYRKERDSGT